MRLVEVSRSMLAASARMRRILSAKSATTRLLALRLAVSEPCGLTSGRNVSTAATASIRSEEHTSELQSLMRISYAVFCLKKKIQKKMYTQYKASINVKN